MEAPKDEPMVDRVDMTPSDDKYDFSNMGNEPTKQTGGLRALVTPVLIALIVGFIMIQFWALPQMVSKDDFTTNIQNMVEVISGVQASQETLRIAVTNKADATQVNALSNEIASLRLDSETQYTNLQEQLDNLPTKAQMEKIPSSSDIAKLISDALNPVNDSIEDINTEIADLKEEKTVEAVEEDISLDLENYDLYVSSTDGTATMGLYVRNKSNQEIRITKVSLVLYPATLSTTASLSLTNYSSTVPLNWAVSQLGSNFWLMNGNAFASIGGWKIPDDSKREAFLSLVFNTTGLPETPLALNVELNDFEYEVVE